MDMITLAMAKTYTDSQRLASIEYFPLDIVYDGDSTDKFTIAGEDLGVDGTYVRVSDSVINGGTVKSVWYGNSGGHIEEITNYHIESYEDIWMLYGTFHLEEHLLVLSCANAGVGIPTGTYFLSMPLPGEREGFIYSLHGELTAVIHPIDPKYLPGVCLPVVELSTEPTVEGATLTKSESALMDALSGAPCIIKFPYNGMTTYCCPSAMSADGVVAYYLNCADAILVLGYEGGSWVFARP